MIARKFFEIVITFQQRRKIEIPTYFFTYDSFSIYSTVSVVYCTYALSRVNPISTNCSISDELAAIFLKTFN